MPDRSPFAPHAKILSGPFSSFSAPCHLLLLSRESESCLPVQGDPPRLVTAFPTPSHEPMPAVRDIAILDLVELTESVGETPPVHAGECLSCATRTLR